MEKLNKWVSINDELPQKNTLVWVKRKSNKKHQEPIYLAKRNGTPLTIDEDASKYAYWEGVRQEELNFESISNCGVYFPYSFSDVTVLEWQYFLPQPELSTEHAKMVEMLTSARTTISRLKLSMLVHPDCTSGSQFDDYTNDAQKIEEKISTLLSSIKKGGSDE